MRHEPLRRAVGLHFFGNLAESQRLSLRADVSDQYVVMRAKRIESLSKRDEVARDEPGSLVNELIERVLAVGSRLAPIDWTGLMGDFLPVNHDVLAIAFHGQLLEICREPFQVLLVGQDRRGLRAEKVVVPDG